MTLVHSHDTAVCRADVVDVLHTVEHVGDPEEKHQRPEHQKADQTQDQSEKVGGAPNPILQNGLHLSSLAVDDRHRVLSEANRYQNCRRGRRDDSRGGLLLHLRRWRLPVE